MNFSLCVSMTGFCKSINTFLVTFRGSGDAVPPNLGYLIFEVQN